MKKRLLTNALLITGAFVLLAQGANAAFSSLKCATACPAALCGKSLTHAQGCRNSCPNDLNCKKAAQILSINTLAKGLDALLRDEEIALNFLENFGDFEGTRDDRLISESLISYFNFSDRALPLASAAVTYKASVARLSQSEDPYDQYKAALLLEKLGSALSEQPKPNKTQALKIYKAVVDNENIPLDSKGKMNSADAKLVDMAQKRVTELEAEARPSLRRTQSLSGPVRVEKKPSIFSRLKDKGQSALNLARGIVKSKPKQQAEEAIDDTEDDVAPTQARKTQRIPARK